MKNEGFLQRRRDGFTVILRFGGERLYYGPRDTPELRGATRNAAKEWAHRKLWELEAEAKAKARAEAEAAARQAEGLPAPVRFSELLALFRQEEMPTLTPGTRKSYNDSLGPIERYFIEELGDPMLEEVHARHIKGYLSWRRVNRRPLRGGSGPNRTTKADGRPVHPRTVGKDRAVLHRLFSLAERLEYRDGNPVARVPAPKYDARDPVLLSDDQYEALLRECEAEPMLHLYALVLGETGTRAYSEALHLTWPDVDLNGGFIWVASGREGHRTKSGKGRWIPMTPRLHDAMREHFARFRFAAYHSERTPWLFHHVEDRRHYRAGARVADFRVAFNSAAERAKVPAGFHRHDLRHRRATSWLAAGANVVHVKEALGHADLRTTMGYTHLSREHLRSLVEPTPKLKDEGEARDA